jgi:hypothetical protein
MFFPSLVVMPRDTDAWISCMSPVPEEQLWSLDIVKQIHILALSRNLRVDRHFLNTARSFLGRDMPALPPQPTPPPNWNNIAKDSKTVTWTIPFDPSHEYNQKPGFSSSSRESRRTFTENHRRHAERAKIPISLSDACKKVCTIHMSYAEI